jgi:O-antigen ligase
VASQREAHNMFIEVAAETGIVGFFIFGILLLISFRSVINARRFFLRNNFVDYAGMATGFLAGLSGYFVAAMFVHNAYPRYFYLLLGIALSLAYVNRNKLTDFSIRES